MKLRLDIPVAEIRNLSRIIDLEMKDVVGRSHMEISSDQENYHIDIESPDMASFKAAVSSITRWLIIIKRIEEVN
jgi:tRNA threonylcarbamoyladenosine modification (KEOPS) complex  Pcc1 subunit